MLKLKASDQLQSDVAFIEITGDSKDEEKFLYEAGFYDFKVVFQSETARSNIHLEPAELFKKSGICEEGQCFGRFETEDYVGEVEITLRFDDSEHKRQLIRFKKFIIKSKKLNYETEYSQMLVDIAEKSAEALLDGNFIASDQFTFDLMPGELDLTALSFLVAKLESPEFKNALATIQARPDHRWDESVIEVSPGRGAIAGARLARAVGSNGRKVPVPEHISHLPVTLLPRYVPKVVAEIDFDSVSNRFIRYVLINWQAFARNKIADLQRSDGENSGPIKRALDKLSVIERICSAALMQEPLRTAGRLTSFPQANTVLTSKPGYRDIFRMFLRYRLQAKVALSDSIEPFSISKKNVASLYEMWCYLEVMNCLDKILGKSEREALFKVNDKKFSLILKSGESSKVEWRNTRFGRELKISLWYNKSFKNTIFNQEGSWANEYKPDISLQIESVVEGPKEEIGADVWVHFDAKYKVEIVSSESDPETIEEAKKADFSKMHTYRDALRRTAGSYILYPGNQKKQFKEFHEILPGLGAFPLRPADEATEQDRDVLTAFITSVIDHCANQATTRERMQFWASKHLSLDSAHVSERKVIREANFLTKPPADTNVLVGYVRPENVDFVHKKLIYNLRADTGRAGAISPDDGMLAAEFTILWSGISAVEPEILGLFRRKSNWYILDSSQLTNLGYQSSHVGMSYFACDLENIRQVSVPVNGFKEVLTDVAPKLSNWSTIFFENLSSFDSLKSTMANDD